MTFWSCPLPVLGVLDCHLPVGSRGRSGPEERPGQTPGLANDLQFHQHKVTKGHCHENFAFPFQKTLLPWLTSFPSLPLSLLLCIPSQPTAAGKMNGVHSGEKNKPQGLLRENRRKVTGVNSCKSFSLSTLHPNLSGVPNLSIPNYPLQNLLKHSFQGLTLEFCFNSLEGARRLCS